MPTERLKNLIALYFDNIISEDELKELHQLVTTQASEEDLKYALQDLWDKYSDNKMVMPPMASDKIITAILSAVPSASPAKTVAPVFVINPKVLWLKRIAAAASIVLIFSLGYLTFRPSVPASKANQSVAAVSKSDIMPGGQKAILTLSDGTQVILDSAAVGLVGQQGNTNITKLSTGEIVYSPTKKFSAEILYNTMSTPAGGQYQLTLPDGSKVWLNAASSITYPTVFSGKERRVEIKGEAYFEVAKNTSQPFIVKISSTEVKVLGTHFNVNAYADELEMNTTLLEGSISISNGTKSNLLKPGNQARLNKAGEMNIVSDADTEEAVAWKNGNFQFKTADLSTVLRQVARWYDIEVEFKGALTNDNRFTGKIPMNVSLSRFLKWMEWSDVHFKIEAKKIVVMP